MGVKLLTPQAKYSPGRITSRGIFRALHLAPFGGEKNGSIANF